MIFELIIFSYAIFLLLTFATAIWGMVTVGIEMFRHREGEGIQFFKNGNMVNMSNWFDRIPGERFYR